MSLSKPEAAPSVWCYVFTKFCNAGAGGTRALITRIGTGVSMRKRSVRYFLSLWYGYEELLGKVATLLRMFGFLWKGDEGLKRNESDLVT